MENYCKPPKPILSELKLRYILRSRKIPFKSDQVIWYTSCDCFTPYLIIGKRLIIEVDGKVHDKELRKTLDRIRKRALENMGYTIRIVKNEQVRDKPNKIADNIIEMYYQLSDAENKKETIITELKKPLEIKPIPKEFELEDWVQKLNEELDDDVERWSISSIKESLSRFHHELVKYQRAMEKFLLSLFGYKLRKKEDGDSLDFEYSLEYFKKVYIY
jgi:very-short-patch-repair endonuclease